MDVRYEKNEKDVSDTTSKVQSRWWYYWRLGFRAGGWETGLVVLVLTAGHILSCSAVGGLNYRTME